MFDMPRYKCLVEYDGLGFNGWQKQDHAPSIQACIENAINLFSGEQPVIYTAGRTDAGVHALGQVFHFDLIKEFSPERVRGAINQHLKPHKIAIINVEIVSQDFHARFSAKKRYYQYRIINRRSLLALELNRAWHVPVELSLIKMQEAANYLIGHHDFSSFRDGQCQAKSPFKTIDEIKINQIGDIITIDISARSFLHHMVRNIVGTLKMVGEGKWQPDYINHIIAAKDRKEAGPTAPAEGLYFVKVDY